MSKYSLQKTLRRNKRQAKKALKSQQQAELLLFKWKQFLGIQESDVYYPSHDPEIGNHRRVVGQRIQSGRIKINGTN